MICKVMFPIALNREFDYIIPEHLSGRELAGARVRVRFGRFFKTGIITGLSPSSLVAPSLLREIESLADETPLFGPELIDLAGYISETWGCPLGLALWTLVPPYVKYFPPGAPGAAVFREPALSSAELTAGQKSALYALTALLYEKKHDTVLLFGDAGTGKSEIYSRLIASALGEGGQALFLLPDIALAGQFIDKLNLVFGPERVLLFHSKISPGIRAKIWQRLASGEPVIAVGTRSAALLPFRNLRLAIVDEEHDDAYKQEENRPNYHARDVLAWRAARHNALLVLSSAAPSVETLHRGINSKIKLLRLKERVPGAGEPPEVKFAPKKGLNSAVISDELSGALKAALERGEQSLVIIDRKGYSGAYACRNCGWSAHCAHCGGGLVQHKAGEEQAHLLCRRCGRRHELPQKCPVCANLTFRAVGIGTQRAVGELKKLFPGARILRFDADTLKGKSGEGRGACKGLAAGECDILVGTKLLSRGYRFPKLSVVGVIDADTELFSPDFRASEKTCQLLVSARGRLLGGAQRRTFIIQTKNPSASAFSPLVSGDYMEFAIKELDLRRDLRYPPFSRLARVICAAKTEEAAQKACEEIIGRVNALGSELSLSDPEDFEVAGPVPCLYGAGSKLKRCHFILKTASDLLLRRFTASADKFKEIKTATTKLVVDPASFY